MSNISLYEKMQNRWKAHLKKSDSLTSCEGALWSLNKHAIPALLELFMHSNLY